MLLDFGTIQLLTSERDIVSMTLRVWDFPNIVRTADVVSTADVGCKKRRNKSAFSVYKPSRVCYAAAANLAPITSSIFGEIAAMAELWSIATALSSSSS